MHFALYAAYGRRALLALWLLFASASLYFDRSDDVRLLLAIAAWAFTTKWLFGRLVSAVKAGKPFNAALSVWMASPIPLAIIVVFIERRPFTALLNLHVMPLSLIIGDTVVLPAAAAIAAWSVKMSQDVVRPNSAAVMRPDLTDSPITWWVCALLGLVAGVAFHVWDAGNYMADHLDALVWSVSKMWHDLVTYPALAGGLLFAFVVTAKAKVYRRRFVTGYVACLLAWVALGINDGTRGLDPRNFHTPCNLQCGVDRAMGELGGMLGHLDGFVHSTLDMVRTVFEQFLIT